MSWTRARREKWAFAVLLAFVIGAAAIAAVPDSPNQAVSAETTSPQPSYDLSGRIVTREHADGRIEFCFEPAGQELVCPDLRFLDPGKVRPNRWIHSSEISWSVPIEPELVLYEQPTAADDSCELDFERMFAATWKVETTRARGTAFSIGDGRFVTAHHVIEDVPPYLTLTHGDRAVAAGVLGSDPEHDVALLEVFDPALVADVPAVEFRNPTKADVGAPVYLVGYPSAGALTAATGIITRVWEDEILTNSSSQGGNSGGPMFDACGDVLGVLWAGSRVSNFSHSGEVLQTALAALPKQKPLVVAELPTWLTPPGVAVWHYAALPPRGVDCVGVEGEWWIGLAGTDWWELENRPTDLNSEGQCGWGTTNVVALSSRPIEMSEDSEPGCVERFGPDGDGEITSVLHEADVELGHVRLVALGATTRCPWQFTHKMMIDLQEPTYSSSSHRSDLIAVDGRVLTGDWRGKAWHGMAGGTRDQSGRSPRQSFHQAWEVPADFEIGRLRIVMGSTTITFKIEPPPPPPHVRETARIAIRVKSGGTALTVCLARADGERLCPDLAEIGVSGQGTNWVQSATLRWSVDLSTDTLDDIAQPGPSCAVEPTLGELAWQVTALGENGSAVYVGRNQFLTSDRLFTDSTPWAVIARGDVAFPAVRVARDQRDGLALVEVIGETSLTDVPDPVRFSETSADAESCGLVLIGYPWGDADRFAMTRLQVHEVTERLIKHDGWGWERAGAPLIDPCTWEVLGISTGNNEAIRAETVGRTLEQLRGRRVMPELADQGPTLLGSVALLPQPVYLGTEQPDFGGWICNVRPSARYDVLYAVYLVSHASPEIVSVRDGERIYPATCGWRDRIFILEYRSDERPSAVCAEPSAPSSPLSSLSLDLAAPAGIELLQVTEFKREDCAGLDETTRWSSTHFVRLRNTGAYELEDLVVQFENEFGERFTPRLANYDPDPDVRGWRFDLGDSEPSRLLVWASRDRRLFEGDPECVEKHDRRGDAIVSAVLYESSAEFGTFRLLTYAAPWRCPWAYTHGVEITLADPLPEKRWFSVSLFGADGTVISGDWFSKFTTTTHYDDSSTTKLVQPWEVPEDFTPIELGVQIGDRFWAVPLPALE